VKNTRTRLGALFAACVLGVAFAMTGSLDARADLGDDAAKFAKYAGYVNTAYSLYQRFLGNALTLDEAVGQIQASIIQAEAEIKAHIEAMAAGEVKRCTRTVVADAQDASRWRPDPAQNFASYATDCVSAALSLMEPASDKFAIDSIGVALNVVAPLALVARQVAGFQTKALNDLITQAYRLNISKLLPACHDTPLRGDSGPGLPLEILVQCVAFNGNTAADSYTVNCPVCPTPIDRVAIQGDAMRNTSYVLSKAALAQATQIAAQVAPPRPSSIAATVNANGQTTFYGLTTVDTLLERHQVTAGDPSVYTAWSTVPDTFRGVASAADADGRMELFTVTTGGAIFHRWQTDATTGAWSAWTPMDGRLSSIAVARDADNRLVLIGANYAGNVFWRTQTGNGTSLSWTSWSQFDGGGTRVAAGTNRNGRVEVFRLDANGDIAHRWQTSATTWSPWTTMDGNLSTIAVARNALGQLEVFGTNATELIYHRTQSTADTSTSWGAWVQYDGWASAVAATTGGNGGIELLVVNRYGVVWHRWQTAPTTWTNWMPLDGTLRD